MVEVSGRDTPGRAGLEGPVWALGAMSGTSLDGVDAAMVLTDGREVLDFGPTAYRPYTDAERRILRRALGAWPDEAGVAQAARVVEDAHVELLSRFDGAAIVGFHGQTLAHDPGGRRTHQAGDGAALSDRLGLPVVWDFRTADVRLGGQGAPLAPFFHHACARRIGAETAFAMLNLGGVGNLTWIDPTVPDPAADGALLAFDTGPANAPIDDLMQARLGRARDEAGDLASRGRPDSAILWAALNDPYFAAPPPKSLDRDHFSDLVDMVAGLEDADAAATLTTFAAMSVARGLEHCARPPSGLLVTGGGRKNAALMAALKAVTEIPIEPVEAAGLDGDMLEAQAFAYLAVRVARGMSTSAPGTTGVAAPVGGGRHSRPAA